MSSTLADVRAFGEVAQWWHRRSEHGLVRTGHELTGGCPGRFTSCAYSGGVSGCGDRCGVLGFNGGNLGTSGLPNVGQLGDGSVHSGGVIGESLSRGHHLGTARGGGINRLSCVFFQLGTSPHQGVDGLVQRTGQVVPVLGKGINPTIVPCVEHREDCRRIITVPWYWLRKVKGAKCSICTCREGELCVLYRLKSAEYGR